MKWHISGPARRDLDGIWAYTATNWSVEQADRYIDSLITRMIWLTKNETLWLARDDVRSGIFSYGEGRHIIFFQHSMDALSIIRVLHERMDFTRHID